MGNWYYTHEIMEAINLVNYRAEKKCVCLSFLGSANCCDLPGSLSFLPPFTFILIDFLCDPVVM